MLSAEVKRKIDREIAKYPADQKQSAVMSALAFAQDEHGWLSTDVMDAVARYLDMPPVAVYEVATFYTMYNLKPQGRFKVAVCTNLPCALSGATAAAAAPEEEARRRLQRHFGGRLLHAEGRRVHGRMRRRPGADRQRPAHVSFMSDAKLDELVDELREAAKRGEGRPGLPKEAEG